MMRLPLAALAFLFSLGIITADRINAPLALLYFSLPILLALMAASLGKRLIFDILLSLFIFVLGVISLENSQALPACHVANFISYQDEEPQIIKGFIESEPISGKNRHSFLFRAQSVQSGTSCRACCGSILVNLKSKVKLDYGDGLILRARLYPLSPKRYSHREGVRFALKAGNEADVVKLKQRQGNSLKILALGLKGKAEAVFSRFASPLGASILKAMVLGERKDTPRFVSEAMMKSGTVHILVVSGFNVGIVAFAVNLFLKALRLSRRWRIPIALACLLVYCLMTGASTPVVRATVMAIFLMLGLLAKRETDIGNSLSVAGLFILALNPRQLFDIGFQLSFASVASIAYIYPKIKSLLPQQLFKLKYLRALAEGLMVSLSAWLGTAGLIACYFRIFSPVAVIANLFIVPLAALITLCGFSQILVSLLLPELSPYLATTSELLVLALVKVNALLLKLPAAYFYFP